MTPDDLAAIRERAESHAFAYSEMIAIGKGVGGLRVHRPDLYEDMEAWSRSTDDDHADTVLTLLDHVDTLTARLAAVRELHQERPNSTSALYPNPLCSCGKEYPCPTIKALEGDQ